MNQHEELPASQEDLPASLPRTCSIPDLTKLFKRTRSAQSQSHASTRRSENNISENSQVLYMADSKKKQKSRENRQSLSSIGNCVDRRFDGSSDEREDVHEGDTLSWDIIDQEIYEWQYVCQTGRPYWWSPESKYSRLKRYQPRLMNEPAPKFWMRELDDRPKPAYAEKRRAVSDNYFCDPKTIHDLAHLVAIQLLGACFTLPPDHILGIPAPNYTIDKTSARLPDSRMISSLRMHTQFRYSPGFGHQARNTSPVQAWPKSFVTTSPGFSSPIADIGSSASASRRKERRRTLNLTDGSGCCGSLDSDGEHLARSCSSNDGLDSESKKTHHPQRTSHTGYTPMMESYSGRHAIEHHRRKTSTRQSKDKAAKEPERVEPKTNYRLEPVIRSEPHHVFIQPVRELVVKRWTNFKRRLSGSLHSALPTRGSEDQESASEVGSPAISSDGKARRLRAQERGEIHSSDVEGTVHFNTPTSGRLSPASGMGTPDLINMINGACFRLSDPSIAEAALAAAERRAAVAQKSSTVRRRKQVSPSESSLHPMGCQTSVGGQLPTAPSRPAFPFYSPARFNPPAVSNSFSSGRKPNRDKRKSTLSEMYTADDVQEAETADKVSSAPATASVTPMENGKLNLDSAASNSAIPILRDPVVSLRPKMGRTSTSGTQIFTPGDDGIELDGLPVGPPDKTWIGPGRRERTYL
ncbi:hypothetical protein BKA61DRAFT_662918 [Leptodontidium sp. MPI-SDFR-AT-0119]|nr:hypothetical protein BKA61DRAFT_662918 [Leptodontidium sp. MPI-SDFR-AT-0119]